MSYPLALQPADERWTPPSLHGVTAHCDLDPPGSNLATNILGHSSLPHKAVPEHPLATEEVGHS